jgi:hypothetical protein
MKMRRLSLLAIFTLGATPLLVQSAIRNRSGAEAGFSIRKDQGAASAETQAEELQKAAEAAKADQKSAATSPAGTGHVKTGFDRADAFVAGPEWEFDGFVSGAQNQNVRSMFFLNDLLYLNIGSDQGVTPGEKIGIYKRGGKVRDPQNGRFLGYEVRRVAVAKVTDRVGRDTCSVRISNTYEDVEIGDLIRRGE